MLKKIGLEFSLFSFFLVYLLGCGSSGSGFITPSSTTTPVGTPIDLAEVKSFDEGTASPGTAMAFIMAGTVGNSGHSNNLTGVFVTAISNPTTTNEETYHVVNQTISMTNTVTGLASMGTSTSYVRLSGYVSLVTYDYGVTGIVVSQTLLPPTAKVGESGSYITWKYSDGTAETGTWKIDPGNNGDGVIVFTYTDTDSNNEVTYTEVEKLTIKPDGSVSARALKQNYISDGITVELSGNRAKWPKSITVTPSSPNIPKGTQQQFTATGNYADGTSQDLTSYVFWSSSTPTVATISNVLSWNGLATSSTTSSTTITATLGDISGSTTLIVGPKAVVSLALSPTNPSIFSGATQQFTATGSFSDGSAEDLTTKVTWNSSAPSVAAISNSAGSSGKATGVAGGSTTVSATYASITNTTTLTVSSTWAQADSGTTNDLYSVAWSGSRLVAVGDGGTILTSPDGLLWSQHSIGNENYLRSVIWTGTQFVAVGEGVTQVDSTYSTPNVAIFTSSDGVAWTKQSVGSFYDNNPLKSIVWSGTLFVTVGGNGSILTSQDGVTWTGQRWVSQKAGNTPSLYGVAWSGSRYVAVGSAGAIITSPDGVTWTEQYLNGPYYLYGITWSDTQFVAVGENTTAATILTSSDGVTWTDQSTGIGNGYSSLFGVAASQSKLVAVGMTQSVWGQYGPGLILESPNGVTWTQTTAGVTNPQGPFNGATWVGGQLVAVGYHGTIIMSR